MKRLFLAVAVVIGVPFGLVAFVVSSAWTGMKVGWLSVQKTIDEP